jgi:outer membrane immunogenic protein
VSLSGTILNAVANGGSTSISTSDTRAGCTIGGGLEWMFAPRWSLKGEYLYYDLGSVSLNPTLTLSQPPGGPVYEVLGIHSEAKYKGSIARAGVNFHF